MIRILSTGFLVCGVLATGGHASAQVEQELTIAPSQYVLVQLEQDGRDFRVRVEDGNQAIQVDHNVGSNGPEYLLVAPGDSNEPRSIVLTLTGEATDSDLLSLNVSVIEDEVLVQAFRLITAAGMVVDSASREKVIASAEDYLEAARLFNLASATMLAEYASFAAANQYFAAFDLQNALIALSNIDESSCVVTGYCYQSKWLESEILFAQDKYAEAALSFLQSVRQAEREVPTRTVLGDLSAMNANLGLSLTLARKRQNEAAAVILNEVFAPSVQESFLDTALELALTLDDPLLIGRAYSNIAGYYHHAESDDAQGAVYLQMAIESLLQSDDRELLISTYSNLAITYRALGEYGLAQEAVHAALEWIEESVDAGHARESYNQLAELYVLMGDYDRAESFARQTIALDEESGRGRLYAAKNTLGQILRETNRVGEALQLHEESLRYYESLGHLQGTANLHHQIGVDHLMLGELSLARDSLVAARSVDVAGEQLATTSAYIRDWGQLLVAEGKVDEAITFLIAAEDALIASQGAIASRIEIAQLLMLAYIELGAVDQALSYGEKTIELISNVRAQLEFYRLGPSWSARTTGVAKQYAQLLLEQFYDSGDMAFVEHALAVVENIRAANFLQQRAASLTTQTAEPEIDSIEQTLRRQLTALSRTRAQLPVDGSEYESITIQYFRVLERYEALLAESPKEGMVADLDVESIVGRLADDTAILEYLCVVGEACHVIKVTKSGLNATRLARFDDIELAVKAAQQELQSTQRGGSYAALSRLSSLLGVASVFAPHDYLVVITDYPVSEIPLSALNGNPQPNNYTPLFQSKSTAYIPSLKALQQGASGKSFEFELTVLADPVFSYVGADASAQDDHYRGWVENLPRLPWTAREAEDLMNLYGAEVTRVHSGANATRENLMSESTRNSRIVHIASHAYFDTAKSDLVGIALSASSNDQSGEGDFITLADLSNIGFSAELVVISGCETGQGEYLDGEGTMSLARTFLAQGVDQVLATLWPVSDRASAEFMKYFYQALHGEGKSPAAALQAAQLQIAGNPRYSSPFYWAPYTLTSTVL